MVYYPIALRKVKIVYNFGLSECNRVKHYRCYDLKLPILHAKIQQGTILLAMKLSSHEQLQLTTPSDGKIIDLYKLIIICLKNVEREKISPKKI